MRRILMILPIVLVFGFSLGAGATQGDCETFENHSGHVPGSYDYAEFYEDGQLVATVQTNGQDIYVAPPNESWDKVKKCNGTTTTTQPEEEPTTTTSTVSEGSTTTEFTSTTTSLPDQTTLTTQSTSTTAPSSVPTTTAPTPPSTADDTLPIPPEAPELPLTGISETALATLAYIGISILILGWVFVMSGREE